MTKNLRFYRIQSEWPVAEDDLSEQLSRVAFTPCGTLSEHSYGFEPPVEDAGGLLCRRLAGADLLQLRIQSRVMPLAAVKEALVERQAQFSQRTGRDPSRKETRELKDEVYAELLPRALLKSERVRAFYVASESILAIGTPSANTAERVLEKLREALGTLQAVPLAFKQPATALLTRVFLGEGPDKFALGRECRMRDESDPAASVNWLDMDLASKKVRAHVKDGLSIDRLGIRFDAVLGCSIDQDLVLRKLRFEGLDSPDDAEDEDPLAQHDAEFTLLSGLVTRLLLDLKRQLGGFAV